MQGKKLKSSSNKASPLNRPFLLMWSTEMEVSKVKGESEEVITDNQEYYEITLVEQPSEPSAINDTSSFIKILPKVDPVPASKPEAPNKVVKRKGGRPRAAPPPRNVPPVKILPKPLVRAAGGAGGPAGGAGGPAGGAGGPAHEPPAPLAARPAGQRSQAIDNLIERILKENTNEIDVFFRSMAASVKKLQPNLIPKVKMEVCNVVAKYELQNFQAARPQH